MRHATHHCCFKHSNAACVLSLLLQTQPFRAGMAAQRPSEAVGYAPRIVSSSPVDSAPCSAPPSAGRTHATIAARSSGSANAVSSVKPPAAKSCQPSVLQRACDGSVTRVQTASAHTHGSSGGGEVCVWVQVTTKRRPGVRWFGRASRPPPHEASRSGRSSLKGHKFRGD